MRRIPPPLLVREQRTQSETGLGGGSSGDRTLAQAFGAALAEKRRLRGLPEQQLTLFAPSPARRLERPPLAPDRSVWAPHVLAWKTPSEPVLVWELQAEAQSELLVSGSADRVRAWAAHANRLLDLAVIGARNRKVRGDVHLSLRWVLTNETLAWEALKLNAPTVEHVSIHADRDEGERLRAALVALGFSEIERPATIPTPGHWLQAGETRVHLNTREQRASDNEFPGTAPNHICLAVADTSVAAEVLEAAGFTTRRGGSLGDQVWCRLVSGTYIEVQRRRH